mmetsp:Transcript_17220/g.45631  ORF Transcript_17220/g.45631 Transcript_17220/m.45631 type:complete len:237 (+) Transcript_17220:451-1161(+)
MPRIHTLPWLVDTSTCTKAGMHTSNTVPSLILLLTFRTYADGGSVKLCWPIRKVMSGSSDKSEQSVSIRSINFVMATIAPDGNPSMEVPESTMATFRPSQRFCARPTWKPTSGEAQWLLPTIGTVRYRLCVAALICGLMVSQPGFCGPRSRQIAKRWASTLESKDSLLLGVPSAFGTVSAWPRPTIAVNLALSLVQTSMSVSITCQKGERRTTSGDAGSPMRTVSKSCFATTFPDT